MARKSKEQVMKETEEILSFDAAIITVYEEILNGERKRFPLYTWELPNSMYYAKVLTRYIFEKKLKWTIDDIKEKFNHDIIKKFRLLGMYDALFSTVYDLLNNAYPNRIKPWELNHVPKKFWESDDNKKEALQWLFEEKLQWDIEQIKNEISVEIFSENGLRTLLDQYFNTSYYKALEFVYPGKIKAWELKRASSHYWESDENKRYALKWLFEEQLKWSIEDIKEKVDSSIFIEYGLGGLFTTYFNSSPYLMVKFLYPNAVNPWEMNARHHHIWKADENKRKALAWLIEEKLQWSLDDIDKKMDIKTFENHKLWGLLKKFDGSPYKAIKFFYPNEEFPLLKERREGNHRNKKTLKIADNSKNIMKNDCIFNKIK